MDIYQLKATLDKGKTFPVYVLSGEEEFLIREALSAIKAKLLKDTDINISLIAFEANESVASKVFDELRTRSFFANKNKLVVIENADLFVEKNRDKLEGYLLNPSHYAHMVLICKTWDKRTRLATIVEKAGAFIDCKKLNDRSLPGWIIARAQHYQKKVSPVVARRLIEDVGNNLAILDRHLEKLSIYAENKATIDEEDIDSLVGIDRTRTIFELTDAVAQRNVTLALKILQQMLVHGEDSSKIIGLLSWQIKRLWMAKQILKQGGSEQSVVAELKIVPLFARRFFEQVKLCSEEDLSKKHALLLETDISTKSSSLENRLLLEFLVYRLCT